MFAPLVISIRNYIGSAKFNKLRGKAIAIHCQTITNFCNRFGIESKQRQTWIRSARDNGKKLGLLV